MSMPEDKKTTANLWANWTQVVAIIFAGGMFYQLVHGMKEDLIEHSNLPWHGSVGVEIATLKAMLAQQIEEQRRLVRRMDTIITKQSSK